MKPQSEKFNRRKKNLIDNAVIIMNNQNPMREIRMEKLTVNIGCGTAGEKLDKAKKLLEKITGKKIVITNSRKRSTFGVAKGRPLGCMATLRGSDAKELLKKLLDAVDGKISDKSFDRQGNFSFGVREQIDIPGVRYDPEIGIYGMDACVTLERRGYRVKRKRIPHGVGKKHKIKKEEAKEWAVRNFGVKVE